MDSVDDFGVVDSPQIDGCDRKIGVTELALDHEQWDAFARHLHGMRVAQLMRREPTSHPRSAGRLMQLRSDAGRSPRTSAGRSAQDAEQRPDRERRAQREPRGSCSQAQRSIPTSRRLPPLPRRTRIAPLTGSRSLSANASASRCVVRRARAR